MKKQLLLLLTILCAPLAVMAQATIEGTVSEAASGDVVIGANVYLIGTNLGSATDIDGNYSIKNIPSGTYTIRVSSIGYATLVEQVTITSGTLEKNFEMTLSSEALEAMEVFASRAKERETPIAFTDYDAEEIQNTLASRDIPLILNTAPSVYATGSGGGAGDARVNVRGFDQRNVAVMINGIPMNDMENGWVYWSNWDGVGDVTESLQLQRGLSAVNLATPSIGGTFNIITSPADNDLGGTFKQEVGNDGFLKSTLVLNSGGIMDDKLYLSAVGVRKTGDGYVDGAWTDAYAWYAGATYQINKTNTLTFTALSAPQRHGQNLYMQNAAAYDADYAKDELGYSQEAVDAFYRDGISSRKWNENVSSVSSSYTGKQYWKGETHDRYDENFINERENYYDKPVVSLNWYNQLSEQMFWSTVAYYSGGKGGGSGTYGSLVWDYSGPSRRVDYDATIAQNAASTTGSTGILRNSTNNQWTIGAISKLAYTVNENLKVTGGLDWRTAEIEHFREVRDLLGGAYYDQSGSQLGLGDKIAYWNVNTVDWLGAFVDAEYKAESFTAYGMYGLSTIKYAFDNRFDELAWGSSAAVDVESDNVTGHQVKGGGLLNLNENFDLYANVGFASKVPIFDSVIDDGSGTINEDPENEKFIAAEAGSNISALDGALALTFNAYLTIWKDRSFTQSVQTTSGTDDGLISITGVQQQHMGVELEAAYQPATIVRFDGSFSVGKWEYTDNVSYSYDEVRGDPSTTTSGTLYIKDLKVGNAPQTQASYSVTAFPVEGLFVSLVGKSYFNHYADFDPLDRTDAAEEGIQSWEIPSATLFDLHVKYTISNVVNNVDVEIFGNIFNLLDQIYVQDAVDNSAYNGYSANGTNHSADDAEVFLGLPRTYNAGLRVNF